MPKRELTKLGIEIKKRLLEKQMSEVELAREVGTSKNYITDMLHGRYSLQRSKILKRILFLLEMDSISGWEENNY